MLRATAIGLVSAVALGFGLAAPAQAHMNGGNSGGGSMRGSGPSMSSMRSGPGPSTSFVSHDVTHTTQMHADRDHMDHDHDHDHDGDHDHDRHHFRFFPGFAFGVDTYADDYDPYACWEVVRVKTHLGWHYKRIWVCD